MRWAYRTSPPGPRRGLPRFARTSCDRGGCLLCPEDGGALPGWADFPADACRFPAASPYAPLPHPIGGADRNETSTEVHAIHPSGLPLACGPRMERAPLGFCLMLRTPPGTPATHVRPRPGHEHGPGTTPSIFVEPPNNAFTHMRATSRRRPVRSSPRPPPPGWKRAAASAFPRASHPADQEPDDARQGGDRPSSTDLELHAQLIRQSPIR